MCIILLALARPVWLNPVPDNRAAVMLCIDVSGSMISDDIWPSRIEAAKQTAVAFVRALPEGAKVGLVTFRTHATLVAPPTEDHDRVVTALDALRPQASTAIGDGLLNAVYALPGRGGAHPPARPGDPPPASVDTADLPPAAVVQMSDGGNIRPTQRPPWPVVTSRSTRESMPPICWARAAPSSGSARRPPSPGHRTSASQVRSVPPSASRQERCSRNCGPPAPAGDSTVRSRPAT